MKRIIKWLGLEKRNAHIDGYFRKANARAGVYISAAVIVLESWMILSLLMTLRERLQNRSVSWAVNHFAGYGAMIVASAILMLYSLKLLKMSDEKVQKTRWIGDMVQGFFAAVAVIFGIYISGQDYLHNEMAITFISVMLLVSCVLVWRPVASALFSGFAFYVYYLHLENIKALSDSAKLNLFIMWMTVSLVSLVMYYQIREAAVSDDSMESVNQHLIKRMTQDDLTLIYNLGYFRTHASISLRNENNDLGKMIFLFLDMENFRAFNHQYGYHEGNEYLKRFAAIISDTFIHDLVARVSDDHFAILATDEEIDEKLDKIMEEMRHDTKEIYLGFKVGAYRPKRRDEDPVVCVDHARYACGSIKKHYTEHYREYDEALSSLYLRQQYIVNNIDTAVEKGYLKIYYQPVVWAKNGKVCSLEALARWDDPEYGFLAPNAFVPVLEEYRQIHKVDTFILDRACQGIKEALELGFVPIPVSINISRLDLEVMDVNQLLEDTIAKYQIPKNMIHVEITESALGEDGDELWHPISRIKESGFDIWLDDFGSGYSSLNNLKDFSFDVMKLDMKFLTNLDVQGKSGRILRNIINLADDIGIHTLAEGVETREQADFLKEIGCERLQGYLFSKPISTDVMRRQIRDGILVISEDIQYEIQDSQGHAVALPEGE
ncbi:MAG: GGDEF domain-containing phosphodiesterase [Lachnospiraceae bacterium]|nr:GGDEF domain-containing phosphodiesterase [Lachnospiraceae bacterium]